MPENTDAQPPKRPEQARSNATEWRREAASRGGQGDALGELGRIVWNRRAADFQEMAREKQLSLEALTKIGSSNPEEVVGGIKSLSDLYESAQVALGKNFTPQDKEEFAALITGSILEFHKAKPVGEAPRAMSGSSTQKPSGVGAPSWSSEQINGFIRMASEAGLFKAPGAEPPPPIKPTPLSRK